MINQRASRFLNLCPVLTNRPASSKPATPVLIGRGSRRTLAVAFVILFALGFSAVSGLAQSVCKLVEVQAKTQWTNCYKTGVLGCTNANGTSSTNTYRVEELIEECEVTTTPKLPPGGNLALPTPATRSYRKFSQITTYPVTYAVGQVTYPDGCPLVSNQLPIEKHIAASCGVGTSVVDCSDDTDANGNWLKLSDPGCASMTCAPSSTTFPAGTTDCALPLTVGRCESCQKYEVIATTANSGVYKYERRQRLLRDEYTTGMLIDNLRGRLGQLAFPGVNSEDCPIDANWGGRDVAYLKLRCNYRVADGQKMRYRLSFESDEDTFYKLEWKEVTNFEDGGSETKDFTEFHPGTGAKICSTHEVQPPPRPGTTSIQDERVSIVPPPNTAGPAGSGGPCGGVGGGGGEGGAGISTGGFTESRGGCGSCGGGAVGEGGAAGALAAPCFGLSMGGTEFGEAAASLRMETTLPTDKLGKPSMLKFFGAVPGVTVVPVPGGTDIQQVMSKQALANVATITPFKFKVDFYQPAQVGTPDGDGVRPINAGATPYATWTVENPDASTTVTNRWQITETRDGNNRTWLYAYTLATGTWKLTHPGNIREDEFKTHYVLVGGVSNRVETSFIRKLAGPDVLKVARTYKPFFRAYTTPAGLDASGGQVIPPNTYSSINWSEGLIEERAGPDANPQITTYSYYEQGVSGRAETPLQQVIHPNGYWERYEYDTQGRRTKTVARFGNAAPGAAESASRVTTYDYSSPVNPVDSGDVSTLHPHSARLTTESLLGQEISRGFHIFKPFEEIDIACPNPGVLWNDTSNLQTVTKKYSSGVNVGRVASMKRPDGTMAYFAYAEVANTSRTTPVDSGQPNVGETALLKGTRTVTIVGVAGGLISRTVQDVAGGTAGAVLAQETYSNYDQFNRPRRVTFLDGTYVTTQFACCGIESMTDRDGVTTTYQYDDLKRVTGLTRLGITTSVVLDAAGRVLQTRRTGTDASVILQQQALYDTAGRMSRSTNALNGVTTYAEAMPGGFEVRTTVNPDGGKRVEASYQDGSIYTNGGTAAFPAKFQYGVETDGGQARAYTKEIKIGDAGSEAEWTKSYTDGAGRSYKTVFSGAGSPYRQAFFNNLGQQWKEQDPDGVVTLYGYNQLGEAAYTCIDSNRNDVIDLNGLDRITQSTNDVVAAHGITVRRSRAYAWGTDNSANATLLQTSESALNGLQAWLTTPAGEARVVTTIPTAANGWTRTVTQFAPDGSSAVSVYVLGRLQATTRRDSGNAQLAATTYGYDAHGRQNTMTDARNGTATYAFNNADQPVNATTPPPGTGQPAQTTATQYDTSLRGWQVTQPDGTVVVNEFHPTGLLRKTSGSRTYPVEYAYDPQGRMRTMTTWQQFATLGGPAVTTWNYDATRG